MISSKALVYPPPNQIYTFTQFPLTQTKVLILGQDPYHGPSQAHGLSFSVNKGIKPPPSLLNIFKELENEDLGFLRPNHGCLLGWATQGVLLLNASLTVTSGDAGSHSNFGWQEFTVRENFIISPG